MYSGSSISACGIWAELCISVGIPVHHFILTLVTPPKRKRITEHLRADNQLVEQLSKLFAQSGGQSTVDREEKKFHQLAKTHWRDTKRLHGRENDAEWKKDLIDADYINARDVLLLPKEVPRETHCNQLCTTHRYDCYIPVFWTWRVIFFIKVQTDYTQYPHGILSRLDTLYGVSPAEERLRLVKTLMNLKPEGNTTSMIRQWQRVTIEIEQKVYTTSEICHETGIVFLGGFQQSFIHTQLDSLLVSLQCSKGGSIMSLIWMRWLIRWKAIPHRRPTLIDRFHIQCIDRSIGIQSTLLQTPRFRPIGTHRRGGNKPNGVGARSHGLHKATVCGLKVRYPIQWWEIHVCSYVH